MTTELQQHIGVRNPGENTPGSTDEMPKSQVERLKAVCATLQEELRGQETSDQEGESLMGFAVVATCSAGVALARCARAARRGPSIEPMSVVWHFASAITQPSGRLSTAAVNPCVTSYWRR